VQLLDGANRSWSQLAELDAGEEPGESFIVVVEQKRPSRRSAIDRNRPTRPAIRLDGMGRGLREHRQNLGSLQNGEVGRLAEVLYEPIEQRRGNAEQPLLARTRREREEPPTQTIVERRLVAVNESTLGERL